MHSLIHFKNNFKEKKGRIQMTEEHNHEHDHTHTHEHEHDQEGKHEHEHTHEHAHNHNKNQGHDHENHELEESHDHDHDDDHETLTIIDEEGNEELFEILLTFDSEDFDKSYVLLYPAGQGEGEEVEIQAFSYVEADGGLEGALNPIESEEEWDMIEEVLNTFVEEEE